VFALGVTLSPTTRSKFVSTGGNIYGLIFENEMRLVQTGRSIVDQDDAPSAPSHPGGLVGLARMSVYPVGLAGQ